MRNHSKIIIIFFLLLLAGIFLYSRSKNSSSQKPSAQNNNQMWINQPNTENAANNSNSQNDSSFQLPINQARERVTKKPFGIYITPQNSPVSPERFSGYHTGTDFETTPEEENSDVSVYAITDGKILEKKWISGYGGVLIESAEINGDPVTIVYGHLNLDSIDKNAGDEIAAGEQIGLLGKEYSQETDNERKHLHLGIHKGKSVNVRGYVNNKTQLSEWIDAMILF